MRIVALSVAVGHAEKSAAAWRLCAAVRQMETSSGRRSVMSEISIEPLIARAAPPHGEAVAGIMLCPWESSEV